MALSADILFGIRQTNAEVFVPVSVTSAWQRVIEPGGMIVQDASTITNPSTQIVDPTRHRGWFQGRSGTVVQARMAYVGTSTQDPIVTCWGRSAIDDQTFTDWELLPNLADTPVTAVTLVTAPASDNTNGTFQFTQVVTKTHSWDRRGNDYILFGIQNVLVTASPADAAKAYMEAKAL